MHFFLSKFLFIFSFMALSLSSGCKIDSGENKATSEGEKPSLSFDAPKATKGDPKATSDSDKVKEKELRSAEEERKRFEDEASKLEKMVLVSMGQYLACAINTTNRLTCWAHPIPSNPMSYYPKKTNAELMGLEFTSFATSQDKVCAVKKDGKVLCFIPNDPSKKTAAELAAMGSYQEVLLMDNGHVCLLNRSGSMSCHMTNFVGSTSQYVNQHISPSEIISFSLGGLKTGSTYTSGICFIASNNVVNCQKLALSPLSSPVSNLKASSLKFSPSFTREIAILSPNKKDLTFFGPSREILTTDVNGYKFDQHYSDVAVFGSNVCTIVEPSNDVLCQTSYLTLPKKTNQDLRDEKLKKVSISFANLCGLTTDRRVFCWEGDYQTGIPTNIKAD